MRKKSAVFIFLIIASAITGIVLSTVLIFEYYGISNAAADAVCSKWGKGINNCTIVSASRYAAIRGIPFIKEIPVAAAGFVFYSFILAVLITGVLQRKSLDVKSALLFISIIAGTGFAGDIVLYLISIFIIKVICPLCVMTYISTFIIFVTSILLYRHENTLKEDTANGNVL
ncbi:MAG: hypothetical protein CVV49_01310 [Spirochaetae bacterium HGW-Spirochaetae-5]|nr:MAG: hypothetical protein CVV49_01310 [Spirochaetae bacterium HGW-Spirochaetae-5]